MRKQKNYAEKPYNRCIPCRHREERRCDGPRTSAMKLERWCEFMRDMKEVNGLTNQEIADRSGVSLKTIERLMAQNCTQDIMRETARLIEDAIIGSSNQYPCYLAFEESQPQSAANDQLNDAMRELERALADNADYRAALDNIHASYRAEMQLIREDAQRKIDFLMEQLDWIKKKNDNLWEENNRKAKLVDRFWAQQKIKLEE